MEMTLACDMVAAKYLEKYHEHPDVKALLLDFKMYSFDPSKELYEKLVASIRRVAEASKGEILLVGLESKGPQYDASTIFH